MALCTNGQGQSETQNKRLFIAIELPETVRSQLGRLKRALPAVKWVPTKNLHLTLRFIGETSKESASILDEALRAVWVPGFRLQMDRLGLFERREQTILWVGVKPSPELLELKREIDAALLRTVGLTPDKGRFRLHITLGRARPSALAALRTVCEGESIDSIDEFSATAFTLFSSLLTSAGAVHRVEERYPMAIVPPDNG